MKILHIVPKLNIGGIESMLFNYYTLISNSDIKWDFIVHGNEIGDIEKKMLRLGCNVYHITPKKDNIFKYITDLIKVYKSDNYNIVHAHQSDMCFFPLMIAKLCGIKIRIAHAHTCMGDYNNVNLKRRLIHFLNNLIATDLAYCGIAAKKWSFGARSKKGTWIPNGINVDKFKYSDYYRSELRNKYDIKESDIVLGMVCRLSIEKNIEFSLEIIKYILKIDKKRTYKLFIIGDGDYKKVIESLIDKYELSENIILVGRVDDSFKYYSFFDIFLLPSFFEGFPVSLIEAQCSSLFSIISDRISNESIINDNIAQCSIEKNNVEEWASLIINYEKNKRFYNKELDQYDICKTSNYLIQYYHQIIDLRKEK